MKSNITLCSLLALSLAFTSCKNEEETETNTTTTNQQPSVQPSLQPIPTQTYEQPTQQVNMPAPQNTVQTVSQTPVTTKAGMNPAHGQPGHRCDIAVGAPLNSPATKPAATTITPGKPTFTTTTTQTPAQIVQTDAPGLLKTDASTAPGMNPPHGQPGHVCGTPVGSPLPTTPTATETK